MFRCRVVIVVFLVFLSACVSNRPDATGVSGRIFRHVDIENGRIVLGEPFAQRRSATAIGDHSYRLRHGDFGGAERITVRTDADDVVIRVEFLYLESTSLRARESTYVRLLGEPTGREGAIGQERVSWEDGDTRFELVETPEGLTANLVDLEAVRERSREAQEPATGG